MVTEIIDIGKLRADKYEANAKRITELKMIVNCCEITYKSLLHIEDPLRVRFTNMIERYNSMFKKELDRMEG